MALATAIDADTVRIQATRRRAADGPWWMVMVAFLWFQSTYIIFPGNALLLYPLSASFFAIIFFHRQTIIPVFQKGWVLFLIPIIGILSFAWGHYPTAAIREGLFFLLTAISVTVIAAMLSERQIIRAMFLASLLGTALAATEANTIVTKGSDFLGGKNYFATKMMIGMIVSYAVAANSKEITPIRLAALALVPINLVLVLLAQATTAMILSVAGLFMLIAAHFFWVSAKRTKGMRTFIFIAVIMAFLVVFLQLLNSTSLTIVSDFLAATGKDTTLTGRTDLWATAEIWAEQYPIFGVGLGGFWQPDVGAAQTLNELVYKDPGTVLGFHSAYWEVRVALGYIGLTAFIITLIWIGWHNLSSFILEGSIERSAFLVISIVMFGMTFTESIAFANLTPMVYMLHLGPMTAIVAKLRREKIVLNVRLTND